MANYQVTIESIDEVFQDYINAFNDDYQEDLSEPQNNEYPLTTQIRTAWTQIKSQLPINTIQINDDQPNAHMVSLTEMTTVTTKVDQQLNHDGYYRMAKTLNTILGDVQTLAADQIICLGHTGQSFIVMHKEPAEERESVEYYYGLETVSMDAIDSPKELFQKCRYLMTDQDIQILTHAEDYQKLDAFFTVEQQIAVIQASIVKLKDFDDLDW